MLVEKLVELLIHLLFHGFPGSWIGAGIGIFVASQGPLGSAPASTDDPLLDAGAWALAALIGAIPGMFIQDEIRDWRSERRRGLE